MVGAREGRSRHIRGDVVVLTGVIVLGVTSLNELPLLLGAALENVFFDKQRTRGTFALRRILEFNIPRI